MGEPRDVAEAVEAAMLKASMMSALLLACGEMTAQERRTAKAVAIYMRGVALAALRSPGLDRDGERMREAAERVCHEEQMTAWTSEVVGSLSMGGYLRDDTTYEDVLGIHAALARNIRSIVESAFTHPELSTLAHEEKAGC